MQVEIAGMKPILNRPAARSTECGTPLGNHDVMVVPGEDLGSR